MPVTTVQARSKWKPWLEALPADLGTPLTWSEEELEELKGSPVPASLDTRNQSISASYEALMTALKEKGVQESFPREEYTRSDFAWACTLLWQRSLPIPIHAHQNTSNAITLVPFADLAMQREDGASIVVKASVVVCI